MDRYTLLAGIVVAFLFMSGCNLLDGLGEEDLSFTTGENEYGAGDKVTVYLENNSGEVVGYNLCTSVLQRKVGEGWKRPEEADSDINNDGTKEACTLELNHLESGDEASYTKQLPVDLKDGTYRYQDSVIPSGKDFEDRMTITTNAFTVD